MLDTKAIPQRTAAEIVEALYGKLLFRPADPGSLDHWTDAISRSAEGVAGLIDMLLGSDEFRTRIPQFLGAYVKPQGLLSLLDVSQNGEFAILANAIVARSVEERVVVDVGAYGRSGSNSFNLMSLFGWRGVLVEPNPQRVAIIAREFAGLDFQLFDIAAARYDGTATLHLGVHDEISSIHRDITAMWGEVSAEITVRAERLPSILRRANVPRRFGLLTIDAEGEGTELIEDMLAEGYAPSWIIVEVYEGLKIESLQSLPFGERLKAEYRIAGRTHANLILDREASA